MHGQGLTAGAPKWLHGAGAGRIGPGRAVHPRCQPVAPRWLGAEPGPDKQLLPGCAAWAPQQDFALHSATVGRRCRAVAVTGNLPASRVWLLAAPLLQGCRGCRSPGGQGPPAAPTAQPRGAEPSCSLCHCCHHPCSKEPTVLRKPLG